MTSLLEIRDGILGEIKDPICLDLGCGQAPEPGFSGIDLCSPTPGVLQADLYAFPWPLASGSVDYLRASHFVEHVPDWNAHFAEVYRVLKMGGHYEIIAPYLWNSRWFQDPDHKQAITHERFYYLRWEWMVRNKIEHGRPRINFAVVQFFELLNEDLAEADGMAKYDPEFIRWQMRHSINVIDDLAVVLRKEPMPDDPDDLVQTRMVR